MIPTPKLSPNCGRNIILLPNFSWANAKDIWNNMLAKEQFYTRNPLMMSRHPALQPRMRSILLNWLSEVSGVYQLHRETYYLAMDYFDRYLSVQKEIPKQQLQLVGVTCLFIASKMEEIYPPKINEFAYVTDGACTVQQILTKELVILKHLKWNLCSMTVNSWLTIYMQLYTFLEKENSKSSNNCSTSDSQALSTVQPAVIKSPTKQPPKKKKRIALAASPATHCDSNKKPKSPKPDQTNLLNSNCKNAKDSNENLDQTNKKTDVKDSLETVQNSENKPNFISSNLKSGKELDDGDEFMYQKYCSYFFAQIAHLVDLSMLDIDSLRFPYNIISASALYHFTNMTTVIQCTGLKIEQIQECILWMTPFALAIRDEGFDNLKLLKNKAIETMPNIQAHTVDLKLLEKAQMKIQNVLAERNNGGIEKNILNDNQTSINTSIDSPVKNSLQNSSTILTPPRSNSKPNKT